jgi:hypothetical protein
LKIPLNKPGHLLYIFRRSPSEDILILNIPQNKLKKQKIKETNTSSEQTFAFLPSAEAEIVHEEYVCYCPSLFQIQLETMREIKMRKCFSKQFFFIILWIPLFILFSFPE